jgi:simple sugar transport system substrate-binding protein
VIASGAALPQELSTIQSYAQAHPSTKGLFAVDAGSTQSVAQTIQKQGLKGKVKGGGYDLLGPAGTLLNDGFIQVTIDQQPYLQGFLPIFELFLLKLSKNVVGAADVDTGIKLVDSSVSKGYVSPSLSRYEH